MGVTTETKNTVGGALQPSSFVHLHNHTHHSLLDGLTKIPALISQVKELGMEAVAITDHGTMSGVVEFYKAAKAAGIKPIIGMEAYVAARSRHDRDPQKDKGRYHLIILAMNNQGYKNLMRLSSLAQLEGMYYKPRIDHELLEKYSEGLIILSGCAGSELGENLQTDNYEEAKKIAAWYKSVFGDRYYLELQDHGHLEAPATWDMQVKINNHLEKIASELDIPIVVTSDGHYLTHEDQDAHEILLCVGTGSFLSDEKRMSLKNFELHVTEPKEIISRWQKTHPEAVTNTKAIADRCNVELELGGILIPTFPTPKGYTEKTYLHYLVFQGLAWRYGGLTLEAVEGMSVKEARGHIPTHVLERADYELGVIDRMGFNGYFLIVQDFINWGKDRGIIFGPGRGSAAGSIVSYAVRITELDPLHYDLLFERFLNPDRISMPDVDIDIQDTRRDEVIAYCTEKYGVDRVANIVTFGTMAARAAVRDVARVLQVPYADSDRLAKLIPPPIQGRHIPLSKSIIEDADLKHEYESNPTIKRVLDYAIRLEGTIRSHGVHAAGVVIAPTDIVNYAPVEMSQKGVVATQYPMGPIEELGLLKMDFLGLSNLTIINNALRIIKKVHETDINLAEIPLDDEKTFALLKKGDTTGVFQLESAGMKRYLRDLQPTVFDDIIAMCALYRPGPLGAGLTDSFVKRKNGKEPVSYEHELTKNALESTYGVIVYQEQVMQMSKEMSGFTGGEADTLRKGIGKKIPEVMAKMGQKFIDGAVANGVPKTVVEKIWKDILGFADYAFNKSHSACYGLIAYWTAYLKAHYPEAFMAALMTSDADNIERLAIEISECQHMGIKVLSPDVNESFVEFAVVPGEKEIRFGMAAVKGVGTAVVEEILRAREDGKFTSVEDFAKRVSTSRVNKKAWDSLIKTGAFDELADRSDLLFNLETIQAFASKVQKEALSGQTDLFGGMAGVASIQPTVTIIPAPVKHTEKERLTWERELLGLYISSHPLDNYDAYFEEQTIPIVELTSDADSKLLTVGGLISTIRTIITKSGSKMAFVKLEDKTGETEIIVFPNLYEQLGSQLIQDAVIRAKGKVTARDKDGNMNGDIKMIADEINIVDDDELRNYESNGRKMAMPVNRVVATRSKWAKKKDDVVASRPAAVYAPVEVDDAPKKLYVHVKDPEDADALLKLKEACGDFPGVTDIVLVLGEDKHSAIKMPFKVETTDELVGRLVKILGEDAVVLK
jgi:DNA polymerase-3 subunit alpha